MQKVQVFKKNFYFFIKTVKTVDFFTKKEPWKVPEFLRTIIIDSKYHQDILRVEYHLEEWRYRDNVR